MHRRQHERLELALSVAIISEHKNLIVRQVNQLKNAINTHNESIQFLKKQNAELRAEMEEANNKVC